MALYYSEAFKHEIDVEMDDQTELKFWDETFTIVIVEQAI
jgi:hypothetical protein